MAEQQSNVNHTIDPRRFAREQGQRLEQATSAIEALCTPPLQLWAGSLTLIGDGISAWGAMISKWSETQQQQHH